MAETLFILPAEMTATTILGGNVDIDKYIVNIAFVQVTVIEPLLGTELYDYLKDNIDTLTGDYLTLLEEYVKPITKHEALAEYIEVSNLLVENGGTFMHESENRRIAEKDDTQFLSGKYHAMAQMYVKRFEKWICKNPLVEYKHSQDEVNAQKVKLTAGWYFGAEHLNGNPTAEDYIINDIKNENY